MTKAIYNELRTLFKDPQVAKVAITKNGTVLVGADFDRYGLCETGVYKLTETLSAKPLRIFKRSPRIWNRDIYMRKISKRIGATLIESAEQMAEYLAGVTVGANRTAKDSLQEWYEKVCKTGMQLADELSALERLEAAKPAAKRYIKPILRSKENDFYELLSLQGELRRALQRASA